MNDSEWPHRRSWQRFFLRGGWVGCCAILLTTITLFGSRYLANRRLMSLAKPAIPTDVDPALGWRRSIPFSLEQLIGVENDIALLFRPTLVRVQRQEVTDDRIIEILEACSGLNEIFIHNRQLPKGSLPVIARRHLPETFQFRVPVIRPEDATLLARMKTLKHVSIGEFERSPRKNDWSWLAELPVLEKLEVTLWAASEADVESLAKCPALQNASFSGEDVSDKTLVHLCDAPSLHWLDLEGSQIQLHFADGKKLPAVLESLDLRSPAVDDQSLAAIDALPQLYRVSITGGQVTGTGLKTLARLPGLRQLWLSELSQLTDEGLGELTQSRSFKEIHVTHCATTPAALVILNEIPNWDEIRFEGVTFKRQPGQPKLTVTAENATEVLQRQRELEEQQNGVLNGPVPVPVIE